MKRVREMSIQLIVTLYTLSMYPSAYKQVKQHPQTFFVKSPVLHPMVGSFNSFFVISFCFPLHGFHCWTP